MPFSLVSTILTWTLALWALGWLALPVARRVFAGLPDGGLAAGRALFIVLVALFCFWGATLHVLPLKLAPAVAALAAIACASGWRDPNMRDWARANFKSLAVSDAIFLLGWAAFLWIRLQHPEINDLEKPMDAALLSAAWKADWLPFAHPWWANGHQASFTNYYYFGPLIAALMARALNTAPQFAYNLVQPAFCAFFLSTIWALSAALTRSKTWGVVAMLLVGGCGTLEPLRQWSAKGWMWPFDWFKTSRVIPNTINEYPAFTMAIGDAHAHFYALSFAALWLCLAWSLCAPTEREEVGAGLAPFSNRGAKKKSRLEEGASPARRSSPRRAILVVGGLVLGAWLMTNTWDAPVFGLLFGLAIWQTKPDSERGAREFPLSLLAPFVIAIVTAAPYFAKFHSTVSGAKLDVWMPNLLSFALLWGGWIILGALAFLLPANSSHGDAIDQSARFRRLLIFAGLLALVAPFLFYIRGAFGDGELRHQDTVFKFGLQAWILLGVGLSAELGARFLALRKTPKFVVALALVCVAPILALASASTIWTRAISQGSAPVLGQSLDGMRYLPAADRLAIAWLQRNGRAGEIVMEGVLINPDGAPGGDYDGNWGYVGAFSGLSSTLGWPQHVWVWDGNYNEVTARGQRIAALYRLPSALETARGATELGARYTFFGRPDSGTNWQTPDADAARAAGFAVHEFKGDDGSRALILERIGR